MKTLILLPLIFAACASTRPAAVATTPRDEPVLVATGGPFEIHVVDGRVLQLVPAHDGQPPLIREIKTLDDLRTLYETSSGEPLPAARAGGGVVLNGWSGLECVRAGHACGRAPEATPQAMVVIDLR